MTPTTASPATATLRGGEWLLQPTRPGRRVHARAADRGASADRADRHRLRRQRSAAGARPARAEGLGAGARPRAALRRARPARRRRRRKRTAASSWTRSTSMIVSERMSRSASFGATFGAHANLLVLPLVAVRDRGAEANVPAAAAHRRDRRRVLPERAGLGLRRPRRQDARRPPGRRQLRAQRREDVDHQRRLRRSVHRLRQGDRRRRALHGVPRRARVPGRVERQGRAQDGAARVVDDAGDPAGRRGARRRTCSARSARATRSRSTS